MKPEVIDMGRGIKIPKLDLSSIYIQREAPVSGQQKQPEGSAQGEEPESSLTDEDPEDHPPKVIKANDISKAQNKNFDQFEKEKQMFKMRML